jgi:SAM-dependent methyltransferase
MECGLGFRHKRPADDELSALYRDMDVQVYQSEIAGRARTAATHLKIVQRYSPTGNLLDIGCASCLFLSCAADAGWKVVGLEPSKDLCRRGQDNLGNRGEVICATLQEARLPSMSFDVLTAWDVLEHVPDIADFMRRCAVLLRQGGYLFVNVPDLDSAPSKLLGARWPLLLPEHLNYFNRNTLKLCGERAGLTCLGFGRRMASFSIRYVFSRVDQHGLPGATVVQSLAHLLGIEDVLIPVPLGELWCVWNKARNDPV